MAAPLTLSKSRYVAGLQCHKLLWLRVHEPDAPELQAGAALQARFDTGHRVGERARACFPDAVLIELDPRDRESALAATRAALSAGAPVICEAAFESDGAFAAVDILERVGEGYALVEVKATLRAKPQHLPDLAIQTYLAKRAGLCIERIEVMHLNRAHKHPDVAPLFLRSDVTETVSALVPGVSSEVARQRAMLTGPCPDVAVGDHCKKPYDCPFMNRCWPARPKHDVGELYGMSRKAEALRARGFETIVDLPDAERLGVIAARQRRAAKSGEIVVESTLQAALADIEAPVAFLDFECIAPALPLWHGCAPLGAVPVQYSVHRLGPGGAVEHDEFLAQPMQDPRQELATRLLAATSGTATVLAWSASFERLCIRRLAAAVPQLAEPLNQLASRVRDLLPIVRNHVYHPEFRGSFSLKAVGPVLVPELGYEGLDVADGLTASTQLEAYLQNPELTAEQRSDLRRALLEYCRRDTELLVRVFGVLQELASKASRSGS